MAHDQGDEEQVDQRTCGESDQPAVEEVRHLSMQPVQKFYRVARKESKENCKVFLALSYNYVNERLACLLQEG